MWDSGMKDPQLQDPRLQDLGCTSIRPRICGHRMLACRHMATGSRGSGMLSCRMQGHRVRDTWQQDVECTAMGSRMCICGMQDTQLQGLRRRAAGSGMLGHGMHAMLDVRWQLLAQLEALQKDALVARLQYSSLLQILLCDVTGN